MERRIERSPHFAVSGGATTAGRRPASVDRARGDAFASCPPISRPSPRLRDPRLGVVALSADDLADMALFLASPAASKVSGQVLSVDGHTESIVP